MWKVDSDALDPIDNTLADFFLEYLIGSDIWLAFNEAHQLEYSSTQAELSISSLGIWRKHLIWVRDENKVKRTQKREGNVEAEGKKIR